MDRIRFPLTPYDGDMRPEDFDTQKIGISTRPARRGQAGRARLQEIAHCGGSALVDEAQEFLVAGASRHQQHHPHAVVSVGAFLAHPAHLGIQGELPPCRRV